MAIVSRADRFVDREPIEIARESVRRTILGHVESGLLVEVDEHRDELAVLAIGMLINSAPPARHGPRVR
jgi:hypothetical protein